MLHEQNYSIVRELEDIIELYYIWVVELLQYQSLFKHFGNLICFLDIGLHMFYGIFFFCYNVLCQYYLPEATLAKLLNLVKHFKVEIKIERRV
jgi:hypothetical protein